MEFYMKNYEFLSDNEKKILHYVLNNEYRVTRMTCIQLAKQCDVSKTLVINMSQKLGFDGFNEFKFYIKNKLSSITNNKDSEDIEELIVNSVIKTTKLNKSEIYDKVAKMILASKCVYVVSRGNSKSIGTYLGHLLLLLNIKCINIPDLNLLNTVAKQMNHDEMLIVISLSGKTSVLVDTVKTVKAYGNNCVSLTSFCSNPLVQYSDLSLFCSSISSDTKNNDTITRIGLMAVVDILISHLIQLQTD